MLFAGKPLLATMEAFRMTDAPSESRGSAFCTVKSTPFTFTSKVVSKSSSVILPIGAYFATPAFANRISSLPFCCLICPYRRSRSGRLETSPRTPATFLPISLTAALNSASRRPVMKTYAPSATKRVAAASPMPLVPPVIKPIFPSSLPMAFSSFMEGTPDRAVAPHSNPSAPCVNGNAQVSASVEHEAGCRRVGIQLPVRSDQASLGRGHLPAAVQDSALGADERHGIGERAHDVHLQFQGGVALARGQRRMHGAGDRGIEERREPPAVHGA